jgi:hypothetical protein
MYQPYPRDSPRFIAKYSTRTFACRSADEEAGSSTETSSRTKFGYSGWRPALFCYPAYLGAISGDLLRIPKAGRGWRQWLYRPCGLEVVHVIARGCGMKKV